MIDPIYEEDYVRYHNSAKKKELKVLTQIDYIHQYEYYSKSYS